MGLLVQVLGVGEGLPAGPEQLRLVGAQEPAEGAVDAQVAAVQVLEGPRPPLSGPVPRASRICPGPACGARAPWTRGPTRSSAAASRRGVSRRRLGAAALRRLGVLKTNGDWGRHRAARLGEVGWASGPDADRDMLGPIW